MCVHACQYSVESLVVQDTMIVTDFHSLRFFEWGIENCATHGDLNSLQLPQCVVKIAPCSRAMCKFLRHCRKGKFLQLKVRSLVLWGHYDICPTTLQMVLIVFSMASKKRVALVGLSKVLFSFEILTHYRISPSVPNSVWIAGADFVCTTT